jgi:hypothetical protein
VAFVVAVVLITLPLVVIAAIPDKKPQIQKQNVEQIHKIVVPEKVTLGEIPKGEKPAPEQPKVQVRTQARLSVSGEQCVAWMREAGITDITNAFKLAMKESGCRWNATNASSGAYGIPQALPASKMASAGADWRTNPVTQFRWMQNYCYSRYGGWSQAWSFWTVHRWY